MKVHIELLGPVTVTGEDGVARHPERAQARMVLARLALARDQGTTRDELADVVWPDHLPPTWASALRSLVSWLRAFAGSFLPEVPEPLVTRGGRYVLRLPEGVVIDIEEAQRSIVTAQDALTTGDFAAARELGVQGADTLRAPFLTDHDGIWVRGMRDHLAELLVTGLETASRAAAALGDRTRALLLANEATARAPLRESAHRCLMAAHAAIGNRGEALRAYQRLRRLLAEELGVDPAPDTEAAYVALLGPTTSTLAKTSTQPEVARLRRPAPFVDRTSEMASIEESWGRAVRGRRQLLYITGESGIGKTRLAHTAGQRIASDGGLVLLGRCDQSDQSAVVALQPFVEAIDGYLASTPSDLQPVSDRMYRARSSVEVARLFPAVTEQIVRAAADRPVALLLDDLHWAGCDTLSLFRYVLSHSVGAPLCVVAIARDDLPIPHALREVVRRLEHEGDASRLALGGLDLAATRALVEALRPDTDADGEWARMLLSQTAGNPFMLLEFLRQPEIGANGRTYGVPPVPPSIVDLVCAKLAGIGDGARRLLRAAALAGARFEFDVAARAANLDEHTALDALDMALEACLVVETTSHRESRDGVDVYQFKHEVVRRIVCDQLSGARRRHLRRLGG